MSDDISQNSFGKSPLFRKSLVIIQLIIVSFVIFISLMSASAADDRTFFSELISFFTGFFGK